MSHRYSRRSFVRLTGLGLGVVALPMLAACGQQPTAPPAPKPKEAAKPTARPAPAKAETKPAEAKPAAAAPKAAPAATGPVTINWWHHWVTEESKKKVINSFIEDYQKANSNVKINIRWWEKAEMYPVVRNAITAGQDFPDIVYGANDNPPWVEAGWIEDMSDVFDWSQLQDGAKERTAKTVGAKTGVWEGPLESGSDEIYYNPKIFEKVGIAVPPNGQFTADEFYDVCVKLRQAGFDPFAQGIGDRDYPGRYLSYGALTTMLGPAVKDLVAGKMEWTGPEVREALEWVAKLAKIPVMPPTFATMNLAESHQYFHTPPPGRICRARRCSWSGRGTRAAPSSRRRKAGSRSTSGRPSSSTPASRTARGRA